HVILLGLAEEFGQALNLRSSDYQFSPYYHDLFQLLQIETFAGFQGHGAQLQFATPSYERYGYQLLGQYLHYFPADLWLRLLAAVVQGISYPFDLRIGLTGGWALLALALA